MAGAGVGWVGAGGVVVLFLAVDVSVMMQRQFPISTVPQIQFIDSGWLFLLCVQRRVPTVQNCAADRRDSSGAALGPVLDMPVVQRGAQFVCQGRRHRRRGEDTDSYIQKNMEILQLQYIDKVIDIWFAGPAVFGAVVEETVELPQLRR